ncbi:MAG: hypothetical protein II992_07115 [Lachnospiraceae bacterium]|nr:hypothetical protein [Lachnospiraceae bacterium]
MNKYIEKVEKYKEKVLGPTLEKLKIEYKDAEEWYKDTGHARYFNKMQRCEKQIDEIEKYMKKGETETREVSSREYSELLELKEKMKTIKSKVFYLSKEIPVTAELINLQDILKDF